MDSHWMAAILGGAALRALRITAFFSASDSEASENALALF